MAREALQRGGDGGVKMKFIKMIMAAVILVLSVGSLLFMWGANAVPSGQGQQLFFDDFTSSQLSPNWNPTYYQTNSNGNLSQGGGWLTLTELSVLTSGCGNGVTGCPAMNWMLANNIDPIVSSVTTSQFVFMSYRMIPFNLTQIGNTTPSKVIRNAQVFVGLFSQLTSGTNFGGIGAQIFETDSSTSPFITGATNQREVVSLFILQPMIGATTANCFYDNGLNGSGFEVRGAGFLEGQGWPTPTCTNGRPAIVYTTPNAPIDLNTVHQFTFEMNLRKDGASWVAFQVDQNGWFNVTQASCNCIEASGGTYRPLWPTVSSNYCTGTTTYFCGSSSPAANPNQSVGTMVDYVLVNNYVPSSLPAGQALANPGISGQIGPSGLTSTFPNYWVALAFDIGKGIPINPAQFLMSQIQFGGFILFLLTCVAFSIPGIIMKVRNHLIYDMIVFVAAIVNFTFGVLALWMFGALMAIFISILVGTVPATLRDHDGGGYVQE